MKNSLIFAIVGFVVAVCLPVSSAGAAAIPIVNAGFEDPVLVEDGWTEEAPPGWTQLGGEWVGAWHVTISDFDPVVAPEGENVLYTENIPTSVVDGVAQILTETFAANTDYTLTASVGNSWEYYWSGYSVQLLAGGTVIKEDNNTVWPDYYKWATSTVQYSYDPDDSALVGQPLEIRLLNLGIDMDVAAPSVVGVEFDDVSLTAEYDPTAPCVDSGDDMITWSGEPVELDPNVVGEPPLTYLWSADDPCAVFDPSADVEDPTVTITKPALTLTAVTIANPGFEDPVLTDGDYTSTPPAWTDGYYNVAQPGVWVVGDSDAGAYNPTAADGYDGLAPEGDNVMYATSGADYDRGMNQVLSATLQANTQYDLSALVGNPFLFNGSTPTADYRIELLAGGVFVASDTGPSPADDTTWTTARLTYDSGESPAQLGEALEIRLVAVNLPDPKKEVDFDDVKLTAEGPTPDPYVVRLTLAVNEVYKDTMTIDVYDDACKAAIGKGLGADNPGDFDGNCITDANDLAELAAKWLNDTGLTAPIPK